ncbi:7-cyano-7-deazaguanine synthase QueC [Geofilum sp. OHC36d9]|uniref:7-cyano-7-deazaguanine synthase QueC n=1 Tax=Geofilum sp. OHC36d9 TaxID=3458413 RepID=UPI0040334A71
MSKKAVILLSGGLDSAVALWLARSEGFEPHTLSFNYGQRHDKEIKGAAILAQKAGVQNHRLVSINIGQWGGSSLTDKNMNVEDGDISRTDIPVTYVPARNMVFLSVAASYAEAIGAQDIFIGVSEVDYSGYVDCRASFINAMQTAINQGTVMGAEKGLPITIHAPFIHKTKTEEILLGQKLGVPFENTWSCYRGGDEPCGTCDSCLLRAEAFRKAGMADPAIKSKKI